MALLGLIFLIIIFLAMYSVAALYMGEYAIGIVLLALFAIILFWIVHFLKRTSREADVMIMFNLPLSLDYDYGEKWDKEFQKVIAMAIDSTSDTSKLSDLQHCQKVAEEMNKNSGNYTKDSPFNKINKAFRLTGCHLYINDSQGNTIAQPV